MFSSNGGSHHSKRIFLAESQVPNLVRQESHNHNKVKNNPDKYKSKAKPNKIAEPVKQAKAIMKKNGKITTEKVFYLPKNMEFMNDINEEETSEDEDDLIDHEIYDSRQEAIKVLKHIIEPVTIKEFFRYFIRDFICLKISNILKCIYLFLFLQSSYWEKKPLLIKRENPSYYKKWFSCKEFDSILRNVIEILFFADIY